MNNFTKSSRVCLESITNLTSSLQGLRNKGIKAILLFMFLALSSGVSYAQDYVNGCLHDAPSVSEAQDFLLNSGTWDFSHCVGLQVHLVETDIDNYSITVRGEDFPEGEYDVRSGFSKESTHCDWTYYHVFTVKCDPTSEEIGAGGDAEIQNFTVIYTGGDQQQPKLIKGKVFPPGAEDLNLCYDDRPEPHSTDYIASLYSDNCEHIKVSGDFVKLRTKSKEDDCKWIVMYVYTIWDGCTEPIERTITYTGGDTEAPEFVEKDLPVKEITVDCDNIPDAPNLAWTDNCTEPGKKKAVAEDDTTGLGPGCEGGVIYRTWKIVDNCGNENSYTQTINVNPAPQVYFYPTRNYEISCEDKNTFEAPNLGYTNGRDSDRCGINGEAKPEYTLPDTDCGAFDITYSFTDECGYNITRVVTVTIVDDVNPSIIEAAKDMVVECDGDGNQEQYMNWIANNGGAEAQDNCDSELEWSNNADSQDFSDGCGATGSKTVIFTVVDDCGNASKTYATFTIVDETNPEITAEAEDLRVVCDGAGNLNQYEVWIQDAGGAAAKDDCSSVSWEHNGPAAKDLVDYLKDGCSTYTGSIEVTFTVYDECRNYSQTTATFSIEDSIAPIITEASDMTVECDGSLANYNPDDTNGGYNPNSNIGKFHAWLYNHGGATNEPDVCSSVKWNYNIDSVTGNACDTVYTVTFTASDECGNESSTTAQFHVVDTNSPAIGMEAQDLIIECHENVADQNGISPFQYWLMNNGGAQALDMCDRRLDWTNDYEGKGLSDECGLTGAVTVTFTVTDDCGLSSSTAAEFRLIDKTPPTFTRPQDITIYKDKECQYDASVSETGDVTDEYDGCIEYPINATYKDEVLPGNCPGDTVIKRTWSLEDECGNKAADQVQTIYIEDDSAPELTGTLPADLTDLDLCEAPEGPTTADVAAAYTDNCTEVVVTKETQTIQTGECGWATLFVYTISDKCGNFAADVKISYTGKDQSDPNLVDGAKEPKGTSGIDNCLYEATHNEAAGESKEDILKLFEDNCDEYLDFEKKLTIVDDNDCDWELYWTYTITDNCGNDYSFRQYFDGGDDTPPALVGEIPADLSELDGCLGDALEGGPTEEEIAALFEDCSDVTVQKQTDGFGNNCDGWLAVYTYNVSDKCGNNYPTFKISHVGSDKSAPIITEPADITIECDQNPDDLTLTGEAKVEDCQDGLKATYSDSISGDICETIITRTWNAKDSCENEAEPKVQIITVKDTTAPVIAEAPQNITVECIDDVPPMISLAYTDNCDAGGTVEGEDTALEGGACGGIITRTWNIKDICGNVAETRTQIITVKDTIKPVAPAAPADLDLQCASDVPVPVELTAVDNCKGDITVQPDIQTTPGNCANEFVEVRTWKFTDDCGNSSSVSQTITVKDTTLPVTPTAPADLDLQCASDVPAAIELTAVDNCSGNITVAPLEQKTNGDCDNNFTIIRTWTFTDDCGNSSSVSQTIVVNDDTDPTISMQAEDKTVECVMAVPSKVWINELHYDNTGGDTGEFVEVVANFDASAYQLVLYNGSNGASYATKSLTLQSISSGINYYTANHAGIQNGAPDGIALINGSDVIEFISYEGSFIAANGPANGMTSTDIGVAETSGTAVGSSLQLSGTGNSRGDFSWSGPTAATAGAQNTGQTLSSEPVNDPNKTALDAWLADNGGAEASDNCGGVTWSNNFAGLVRGNCAGTGSATVTFTAKDACGNTSETVATFTIEDNTKPTASNPADITIECASAIPDVDVAVVTDASDNCSTPVVTYVSDVSNNQTCPETITRTYKVTDACGNSIEVVQKIIINDETKPEITGSIAESTVEGCSATDAPAAETTVAGLEGLGLSISDNCTADGDLMVSSSDESTGTCPVVVTRTYTVKDACGNGSTYEQIINVDDTTLPTFNGPLPQATLVECDQVPTAPTLTATDNCDSDVEVTYEEEKIFGTCPSNYILKRRWTAKDDCNNRRLYTQTITVEDNTKPVIAGSIAESTVEGCSASDAPAAETTFAGLEGLGLSISDNCTADGDLIVSSSDESTGTCPVVVTRTYTVKDACDNESTYQQTINVDDSTKPVLGTAPANITISCIDDVPAMTSLDWTDNCDAGGSVQGQDSQLEGTRCESTITRTWNVTDTCGNVAETRTQIITIKDDKEPQLVDACPDASDLGFSDVICKADLPTGDEAELAFASNGIVSFYTDCNRISGVNISNPEITGDDCSGTATYTIDLLDECGNKNSECKFTINYNDTTKPEITGSIAESTVEGCSVSDAPAAETTVAGLEGLGLSISDNCTADGDLMVSSSDESTGTCPVVVTRTYTVKDACGNENTYQQTISVDDTTAPELTVPENITVECDKVPFISLSEKIYATMNKTGARLVVIDPATAEIVEIGPIVDSDSGNQIDVVHAIDFGLDGNLYGTTWDNNSQQGSQGGQLLKIDPVTAIATKIGSPTPNTSQAAIAFDNSGVLWSTFWRDIGSSANDPTAVNTINISTGAVTTVNNSLITGNISGDLWSGMAFNPVSGNILVYNRAEGSIWEINTTTGIGVFLIQVTNLGNLGIGDMFFDTTGDLYLTGGGANPNLFKVDLTTGVATLIAPFSINGVNLNNSGVAGAANQLETTNLSSVSATDDCDNDVTIVYNGEVQSGSGCEYTLTRSWTATDDCGNATTKEQVITVKDTTGPTITNCPDDEDFGEVTETPTFAEIADITATDNCDATPIITFEDADDSTYVPGTPSGNDPGAVYKFTCQTPGTPNFDFITFTWDGTFTNVGTSGSQANYTPVVTTQGTYTLAFEEGVDNPNTNPVESLNDWVLRLDGQLIALKNSQNNNEFPNCNANWIETDYLENTLNCKILRVDCMGDAAEPGVTNYMKIRTFKATDDCGNESDLCTVVYKWSIADDTGDPAFITTWRTTTNNESITIPTNNSYTYNYIIDWGDGSTPTNETGDATHIYADAGDYQVKITGTFPAIYFASAFSDREKIITVNNWGEITWSSMKYAFLGCQNLDVVATDVPDLSNVTDMEEMFRSCLSLVGNNKFGDWDVSSVENMKNLFQNVSLFNQDIGSWDVSSVKNMRGMFFGASSFNQNIGSWDVSSVLDMVYLFYQASSFNQDINNWNVSLVTDMFGMFYQATAFDQDISLWNVTAVNRMSLMFFEASSFNQDIGTWDVSSVEFMAQMFSGATSFNQNISGWDVSSVLNMYGMFSGATSFDQPIGNWNVSSVATTNYMFENANSFNQDLGTWDISSLTSANFMFQGVTLSTANYDSLLQGWSTLDPGETAIPTNLTFHGGNSNYCAGETARNTLLAAPYNWAITDGGLDCSSAFITTWRTTTANESITIPTHTSNVFNYDYIVDWGDGSIPTMETGDATHNYAVAGDYTVKIIGSFSGVHFYDATTSRNKIISIDNWGNNPWETMSQAFWGCQNLDVIATDVPDFSNLNNNGLASMFLGCSSLVGNSSFNNWDVSSITNTLQMFTSATSFNQNISNWNVSSVKSMSSMFLNASSFNQNLSNWDVSSVVNMYRMFMNATSFDQDLRAWDISSLTDARNMFDGVTLSTNNYDSLLEGWSTLDVGETQIPVGVTFSGGNSTYCNAEAARTSLLGLPNAWSISDGGLDGSCGLPPPATDDTEVTIDFKAYPVPFNGKVTISYNFEFDTDVRVEVYDTKGLLVLNKTDTSYVKGMTTEMPLTINGSDQMYYIKVITSKGAMTKKVVASSGR